MAIPENYIDKITKDGESRDICPAADKVRVGNENFDGTDLDAVLNEIAEEMDNAGDGTVTGVKVGDTTYEPTEGVVDLSTPFGDKVDKVNGKGLSTNDYTTEDKTKLGNLPTADHLAQQLGGKANDNAVIKSISVNGGIPQTPNNGNVNVVVPTVVLDDAPTAGSDNGVKSGGVKTALDAKANAADVPTKTEMADAIDDALGEAQVTVVPANSVGVIASLGSDSDEDALSASMGKKLKVAMLTILNALGTYAFPEGKPVIDWGDDSPVTYTVQKTIGTGLSATGGDTDVALGDSLEVSIAITDNLYIIDDDNVVVTMGGSPVQGAWNASTMKVTIAAVTGDVVINIPSLTYVGYGEQNSPLVLMFDGKNQGSTANQWKNLCNDNKPLVLSGGYTKGQDGITFNGTDGTGKIESLGVDLPWNSSAMEAVFSQTNTTPTQVIALCGNQYNSVLAEGAGSGGVIYSNNGTVPDGGSALTGAYYNFLTKNGTMPYNTNTVVHLVNNGGNDHYLNNVALEKGSVGTGNSMYVGISTSQHNNAGEFWVSGFIARNNLFFGALKGTLYAVRAYSRVLTSDELAQNHKVDKKRFNIA